MSSNLASSGRSLRGLILWPALITLAITLVRLVGELSQWSPALFNRAAGGPLAIVGIVWLIPVFGAYFGVRLAEEGARPDNLLRAFGIALLAFFVNIALGFGAVTLSKSPLVQLAAFTVTSWIAILMARPAWPRLWEVLLAYAFAARVPVLVIMFASIFGGLNTHYAKPRPDFPEMGPLGRFFWTALLPQFSLWIFLTVVAGLMFGVMGARIARRPARS